MRLKASFLSLAIVIGILSFNSCTKTVDSVLEIPSTYRYNSPNLFSKQIFAVSSSLNIKTITDTLGSFNRENQVIADSINRIINHEFLTKMIKEVRLLSGDEIELVFGRLDTTMQKNTIVETEKVKTKYTLNGNNIDLQSFPQYKLAINNSFIELNMCNQFVLQSVKLTDTTSYKFYTKEWCTSQNAEQIVKDLVNKNFAKRYDTVAVELVNYIFSRY